MRIAPQDAAGSAGLERTQEIGDVVADVAHALRNHFHRLYYWVDVLGEQPLGDDGRAALEAAVTTLRSVERLTSGTMALTRGIELAPISMDVPEVLHGIGQSLLRQGARVRVENGAIEGVRLAVDASHVSRTIEIVGARLGAAPDRETAIDLSAEVDDEGWVVIAMHARDTADRTDVDVEQMLEWAQAERVVRQHGGRLLWEAAGPAEHRAVLLLPASD